MVQAAIDTSSLEELDVNELVVSKELQSEIESRDTYSGLISKTIDVDVDGASTCVNDIIVGDIRNVVKNNRGRAIDRRDVRDYAQRLERANDEPNEVNRQEQLRRIWQDLSSDVETIKTWQGEKAGSVTDCSLLEAGKETGTLISEDQRIISECQELDDVECRQLRR